MVLIDRKTRNTKNGTISVSVVKTTQPIRPARHTSLKDIRKMTNAKRRRGFLSSLGIK